MDPACAGNASPQPGLPGFPGEKLAPGKETRSLVAAVDFPSLLAVESSFSRLPAFCAALGKYQMREGLRLGLGLALPLRRAWCPGGAAFAIPALGHLLSLKLMPVLVWRGAALQPAPKYSKSWGKQQKEITCLKKKQCVNLAIRARLVYLLSKNSQRADLPQNVRLHTSFLPGSGILLGEHALGMG